MGFDDLSFGDVMMLDVCVYCGSRPNGLDHIVPKSADGPDGWWNRAPACKVCDGHKGEMPLLLFLIALDKAQRIVRRRTYINPNTRERARQAVLTNVRKEFRKTLTL